MAFGIEAGIGFFLALALCIGVCKMVMRVANDVALSRRVRDSRRVAKVMEEAFRQHTQNPLESYEWALKDVASLERYLWTLPPNEEASATATHLVAQAKAVVAICERALRIERIARIIDEDEADERVSAMFAAGNTGHLDEQTIAWFTDPKTEADRIRFRETRKVDLVAAKNGPLTWWSPADSYNGPRGLLLSPTLIAKAEAELDGYRSFAPDEVGCPNDMRENARLIAVAANRISERAVHQPSWMR